MASRGTPRLVVAGASVAVGLAIYAVARRTIGAPQVDASRAVFLEKRRQRMRAARSELTSRSPDGPAAS